jgi:hypothetical protein
MFCWQLYCFSFSEVATAGAQHPAQHVSLFLVQRW